MPSSQVTFQLPDAEAEAWFVRTYLVDAWDRFESMDAFERGWFWRNGRYARHDVDFFDGGRVMLIVDGDPDRVVERERDRWDDLVEEGRVDEWTVEPFADVGYEDVHSKAVDNVGEEGARLFMALKPLLTRTSLDIYEALDEQVPAVAEESADNPKGIGFWVVFNTLAKQGGYDWYDEIDACTKGIQNRLRSITAHRDEAEAQRQLEETIAELRAFSEELSEWNDEQS
jgi:hypothetical protein